MTTEEPLKPRYKVIADYPDNPFRAGTILCEYGGSGFRYGNYFIYKNRIDNYPHLFKKMEWWEEREPEDMPMYLRCTRATPYNYLKKDLIYKVEEWDNGTAFLPECEMMGYDLYRTSKWEFLPATEQEYLTPKEPK